MSLRGAFTVILILRDKLVRADFSGGTAPELKQKWDIARPLSDELATLTDAALRLGGKKAKRIVVLSTDIFATNVRLETDVVLQLDDDDIPATLAFEAESQSGIPSFEARLNFWETQTVARERCYHVNLLRNVEYDALLEAVEEYGGQLLAVGHPGALAQSLAAPNSTERVELWDRHIVAIKDDSQVEVFHTNPLGDRYLDDVRKWFIEKPMGPQEWVSTYPKAPFDESLFSHRFQLTDNETFESWLEKLAAGLTSGKSSALLLPEKKPMSTQTRVAISMLIAVFIAGICGLHYMVTVMQTQFCEAEAKRLDQPKQTLALDKQMLEKLNSEISELEPSVQKLENELSVAERTLVRYRGRLAQLLQALATFSEDQILLQSIQNDSKSKQRQDSFVLSGICLDAASANRLANLLSVELDNAGWLFMPAEQTPLDASVGVGDGIQRFSIRVTDDKQSASLGARTP